MANLGTVGIFLAGFLVAVISLRYSLGLSACAVILIWPGAIAWKSAWMRCPICGHLIAKQSGGPGRGNTFGTWCEKCHVDFAA